MIEFTFDPSKIEEVETATAKLKIFPLKIVTPANRHHWMGIDPGQTNMGLAWWTGDVGEVYQIRFPSSLDTLDRIYHTRVTLNYILSRVPAPKLVCVEQASFGAQYGQAALAENRTAAIMSILQRGWSVIVTPPLAIRKKVFGKGNIRAEDIYATLQSRDEKKGVHNDGASALACAEYAFHFTLWEVGMPEEST